jgi:hypothetical protein
MGFMNVNEIYWTFIAHQKYVHNKINSVRLIRYIKKNIFYFEC